MMLASVIHGDSSVASVTLASDVIVSAPIKPQPTWLWNVRRRPGLAVDTVPGSVVSPLAPVTCDPRVP